VVENESEWITVGWLWETPGSAGLILGMRVYLPTSSRPIDGAAANLQRLHRSWWG
jgi:hypothetical protein